MSRSFDVGATLQLRNLTSFRAESRAAAESVGSIGAAADVSSAHLKVMSTVSRATAGAWMLLKRGAEGAALGFGALIYEGAKVAAVVQGANAQIAAALRTTHDAAGVTLDQVDLLTDHIARMSGISKESLLQATQTLLLGDQIRNQIGKGNDVFNQALLLSADLATRLKVDVPVAAKALGKALQDPVKGMTALRRANVVFTESQQEQIKALVAANDLLGAQKIILEAVRERVGGAAKAAGQAGLGPLERFKVIVLDALETIGKAVLPVLTRILPKLSGSIAQLFTGLAPVLGQVAAALGKVLPGLIRALVPVGRAFAGVFVDLARALVPVVNTLGPILERTLRALTPALKPLIAALGVGLLQIVQALAPTLPELAKALGQMAVAVTPLIPPLTQLVADVLQAGVPLLKAWAWWWGVTLKQMQPVIAVVKWLLDRLDALIRKIEWVLGHLNPLHLASGLLGTSGTGTGSIAVAIAQPRIAGQAESRVFQLVTGTFPFGALPGLAGGGYLPAWQPAWVGERGRELVVPTAAAAVVPESDVRALGGVTQTFNINITEAGDARKTLEAVRKGVSDALARR